MRISFNQPHEKVKDQNGYGYAAKMCKESLVSLGHTVTWRDPTADIEINFIQPQHWHWTGPYRIAYLPWESTKLHDGWVKDLNSCDEVWTPSPVIAQWMEEEGVKKSVRVYQHGVEPIWSPLKREPNGTLELLHHGAEALRKGGNETIKAFMKTLWEEDARLTMKMFLRNFQVHDTKHIRIIRDKLPLEDLVALYHECKLMVYPSWGEGFGLAPIQAAATGMPAIVTKGWAPYEHLLDPDLLIESKLVDSPWPHHHPGQMLQPDHEHLCEILKLAHRDYEYHANRAYKNAYTIHHEYNWKSLTEKAFSHLL